MLYCKCSNFPLILESCLLLFVMFTIFVSSHIYPENPEGGRVIACSISRIRIVKRFPVDGQSLQTKRNKQQKTKTNNKNQSLWKLSMSTSEQKFWVSLLYEQGIKYFSELQLFWLISRWSGKSGNFRIGPLRNLSSAALRSVWNAGEA